MPPLSLVFESPVAWTKKRLKPNWTELQSGSACGYLYDQSFAVWLPLFHFKQYHQLVWGLQLVYRSCETHTWVPTHNPSNFAPLIIKNSWELRKIWPNTFWCTYFVMIGMAFTVLLVPCATKLLGEIGHHIRHNNNTHKHMYHVDFIHLTTLTSCIYILHPTNHKLQTTNYKLQCVI